MQHTITLSKKSGNILNPAKASCYLTATALFILTCVFNAHSQGIWTQSNLSTDAVQMGAVSHDSKVYFAGGIRSNQTSSIIDIYDVNTSQWTTANLSVARSFAAGVSLGSKVFFAGGIDLNTGTTFSVVDIYDTITQQWTTAQLSQPRFGIAAVAYGDEVVFAGGVDFQLNISFKIIDKYNINTNVWSTDSFTVPRSAMGYALAGTKAFFGGGLDIANNQVSKKIDIYDFTTGSWTSDSLSQARGFLAASAASGKIIFAGGIIASNIATDIVDIFDTGTNSWSTSSISQPRGFFDYSASACDMVFFAGGGNMNLTTKSWTSAYDIIDIYEPLSATWTQEFIPSHASINHAVVANGNKVFIAGGTNFSIGYSTVDIYEACVSGVQNNQNTTSHFNAYPNPATDLLTISYPNLKSDEVAIAIIDVTGKIVYSITSISTEKTEINTSLFSEGIYLIRVQTMDFTETKKVMITK